MRTDNCDFCNEFSGGMENTFARIYRRELISRSLYTSKQFVVMPSLGQIVEGYVLIVPVRHCMAIADMSTEGVQELGGLRDFVRDALSQTYGPSILFEHGIRGTEAGGCGVEHAHLHAVPFDSTTEPIEELKAKHSFKPISGLAQLHSEVSANSPYLYYEQTNGQAWVCETERIPSQYVRKLLAQLIGTEPWDWRVAGREQALLNSISRLSGFFLDNSVAGSSASDKAVTETASAVATGIFL